MKLILVVSILCGLLAFSCNAAESSQSELITKLTPINAERPARANEDNTDGAQGDLTPSASDRTFHITKDYPGYPGGSWGGYPGGSWGGYPGGYPGSVYPGTPYRGGSLIPGYTKGYPGGGLLGYGYYGNYPGYSGYGGYGNDYYGIRGGYGGYGGYGNYGGYGGYGSYDDGYGYGRGGYGRYDGYDGYGYGTNYGSTYPARSPYYPYSYRGSTYGTIANPSGYRGYS